jgi:hypothetical protein
MTAPRTPTDTDHTRRLGLRRRVKRGIVASYIHDISERHSAATKDDAKRPPKLVEQAQEG